MAQRTVGLDFGTHQTKICVEYINGYEKKYSFEMFEDNQGEITFAIPSILCIGDDGLVHYGYISENINGEIIRYFKQVTFATFPESKISQEDAILYSIWYLSYILFHLEEQYGQDFAIQMGVPTDSSHHEQNKILATRILLSAYQLVEVVFNNDKDAFLKTDVNALKNITQVVEYSQAKKEEFSILVFPEAYACLKPLTSAGKINRGMSLMIDIGGGTTDISFFTIVDNTPRVYDFTSLSKGLNFLTKASMSSRHKTSNVQDSKKIDKQRLLEYSQDINTICADLERRLFQEWNKQTFLQASVLSNSLKHRPLIYCGGGSTFALLRSTHRGFCEVRQVGRTDWQPHLVEDMDFIDERNLCPLLSTAYGLSIAATSDEIERRPFVDIFEEIRGVGYEDCGNSYEVGWDYGLDYDAYK